MNSDKEKNSAQSLRRRELGKMAFGAGIASVLMGAGVVPNTANATQKGNEQPEGYEGNIAVCTVMIVKKALEADADDVWDRHKKWLKESHGPWGMVSYSVAKNVEIKEPLNPASTEETGRIIYVIHEIYRHLDGLQKHYSESPKGGYVEDFLKVATAEGSSVIVLQGAPVTHSLLPKDLDFPVTIEAGTGVEKFFKDDK